MNKRIAATVMVAASFIGSLAWAGHELPIYPSFYPHEIDIQVIPRERAIDLIAHGQILAYAGNAEPPSALSDSVGVVESLGSYIVVSVNRDSAGEPCALT